MLFCVTPTDSHVHSTLGRIVCMVFRSWLWVMVIVVRVRVRVRVRARARDREWIFNCFFPKVTNTFVLPSWAGAWSDP